MTAQAYLHGYTQKERARLYHQAQFLQEAVYEHVDLSRARNLVEVGCGVGAQTKILLQRFPQLSIDAVDISESQLKQAKLHLSSEVKRKQVKFYQSAAERLPFKDNTYDAAFVCWFLEHVEDPVKILREIRRVMSTSAVIYCSEVLNSTYYVHPYSPAILQYWFEFNDQQWTLKGDPFVGAKLANCLIEAGFQNVSIEVRNHHYDNRFPKKRAQGIDDMSAFLLSAAPQLLASKRVTPKLVQQMGQEIEKLKKDPDSVLYWSWFQAKAYAL